MSMMKNTDRTLWMGDLEEYMDADFIGKAFSKMGEEVVGVKVVYDKYSGRASGYCFVELGDGDAARRAMLNINGKVIPKTRPPKTFNLSFANSPNAPYTEYNLFVNNLPEDVDDAGLFLVFGERYRSCRGAKVYRNTDRSSRGLGFVRFADQTDQQRALVEMNKFNVRGRLILLKLAQPKFRAPRNVGAPQYDPINYYPRYGEYYNQQSQWAPHPQYPPGYNYQPQHVAIPAPVAPQPMDGMGMEQQQQQQQQVPLVQADPEPKDPQLLPEPHGKDFDSVEEANNEYIDCNQEFYMSLEDSRWCPKLLTSNLQENDLSV